MSEEATITIVQLNNGAGGGDALLGLATSSGEQGPIASGFFAAKGQTAQGLDLVIPGASGAPLLLGTAGGSFQVVYGFDTVFRFFFIAIQGTLDGDQSYQYSERIFDLPFTVSIDVDGEGRPTWSQVQGT